MSATPKTAKTLTACTMFLKRTEKKTVLHIKVVPEIENIFSTPTTETSEKYKTSGGEGLKYYELSDKLRAIQDKFNHSGYRMDRRIDLTSYGTKFITDSDNSNFSLLRTKGLAKGIKIDLTELVLEEECKAWMSDMGNFIKFLYINFVTRLDVRANISIEF